MSYPPFDPIPPFSNPWFPQGAVDRLNVKNPKDPGTVCYVQQVRHQIAMILTIFLVEVWNTYNYVSAEIICDFV